MIDWKKYLALMFIGILFGQEGFTGGHSIQLHLGCQAASESCVPMAFDSQPFETILIQRNPEMVLGKDKISEAERGTSPFGQEQWRLFLREGAAAQFEKLTRENVNKRLAIVLDNKILFAPQISSPVAATGGLMITTGLGNEGQLAEKLPWLKQMSETKKSSDKRWSFVKVLSYFILGCIFIAGSIYFAFFRKGDVD